MNPFQVFIAFGKKLETLRDEPGGFEGFDPDNDEEFKLLMAASQHCYKVFDGMGLVIPLELFSLPTDQLKTKIDEVVQKYQ